MLPFITAALGRLNAMFNQEEAAAVNPQDSHPEPSSRDTQRDEHNKPKDNQPAERYPRNRNDILQTISHINRATSHTLPEELLKIILYQADYDCIHLTSTLSKQVNVISRTGEGPPARPCVETRPLAHLGTVPNTGRVRSVHLKFTGRDQGWTSESGTSSWSWFEVGRRRPESEEVRDRLTLAHNAVAGRNWQDFEIYWHMEEEMSQDVGTDLRAWFGGLRDEDMVSIVPMARYAGWQCRVLRASIDIEIELWW